MRDTGVGIAKADLARIFEEFEQVRPGSRGDSMTRGAGLGLAVARKLARLLGGDVIAESELGQGSRFVLTLPPRSPEGAHASDDVVVRASEEHASRGVDDASARG